jgi:F-type H+-transporting ATPase subunit gamma
MESLQNLKRRLKSVQNIGQITKAMELVASTKMRRSQEIALNSRAYAFSALRFLATVSGLEGVKLPALLEKRPVASTLIVVVTSDKGLAGSFNSGVFREFEKFIREKNVNLNGSTSFGSAQDKSLTAGSGRYSFVAVGEKSRAYLSRRGVPIARTFIRFGDFTATEETKPLADMMIDGFLSKKWDEVIVFYTYFITALDQKPTRRQIFPIDIEHLKEAALNLIPATGRFAELRSEIPSSFSNGIPTEYIVEPSPSAVLEKLVTHLLRMRIYHLILEANASEHAARRVAMKNASDNASELSSDLGLVYNKSRQASITQEITEITAGVEALK